MLSELLIAPLQGSATTEDSSGPRKPTRVLQQPTGPRLFPLVCILTSVFQLRTRSDESGGSRAYCIIRFLLRRRRILHDSVLHLDLRRRSFPGECGDLPQSRRSCLTRIVVDPALCRLPLLAVFIFPPGLLEAVGQPEHGYVSHVCRSV